ncbi:hypothetical protein V8E36_006218 [Tilletia maclaganii]
MAREDEAHAPNARKRARRSSPTARSYHPASTGAGLTASDLHSPLNLLRLNGHRDPGRYIVVPEETQALFDKDPELDTLLWFTAPPLDGPTQAARQRNTLVNAPIHSLDYLYQRITEQQEEKRAREANAVTGLDALAAAGDAILAAAAESSQPKSTSRAAPKRGKAARSKRKAPAATAADSASTTAEEHHEAAQEDEPSGDANVAETLTEGEAEARLLASLEALVQKTSSTGADDPLSRYLSQSQPA